MQKQPFQLNKPGYYDWLIILPNLLPVLGVWFAGWDAREVFIVYALETLIIGIFTVLKLLVATLSGKKDMWYANGGRKPVIGLFFIFFFIMHFGIFAAVQTGIFSHVSGIAGNSKGPLFFFFHWWQFIHSDMAYMLAGFIISYALRDFIPFMVRREYQTVPMMFLMFQPYGRILVQQFTVILGSMFLSFGAGAVFILVFALAKIFVELYLDFGNLLQKALSADRKNS